MLLRVVREYLATLRSSHYRGLLLLHGNKLPALAETLAAELHGDCILIAPRRLTPSAARCRRISPTALEHLLGTEYNNVLITTDGLLRPNLVAAAAGMVTAGGVLAVVAPGLENWNPGVPGGRGGYKRYLIESLYDSRSVLWATAEGDVYLQRTPLRAATWPPRRRIRHRCILAELAATTDQADAMCRVAVGLKRGARSVLIAGDRGRGKSFLLGLVTAFTVKEGYIGEAVAVAPSSKQLGSFFRGAMAGLRYLGIEYRVERHGGAVVKLTGAWGRIVYMAPDEARPAGVLIVDEAAALGLTRLRALSWRSGRTLAATTLHGYEGSGRIFAHLAKKVLPKPLVEARLTVPIRYPPGDPLEDWVTKTFILDPDPPHLPSDVAGGRCRPSHSRTSEYHGKNRVRQIAKLLAAAHYRTEPDYLLVMLDAQNHELHVLDCNGIPIAVADVAYEEKDYDEAARISQKLLDLQLAAAGYIPENHILRTLRVVRIAVHPRLQRRGYGSALLARVEAEASRRNIDAVTTVFSRHDVIGFWIRNSYILYYVSPRYNRVTGEKNLAFVKPLTPIAARLFNIASGKARLKLILAAHSVYRDLAAEKIAALLTATTPPKTVPVKPTCSDIKSLKNYINGLYDLEQVMDSAYAVAVYVLAVKPSLRLTERDITLLVARLLQGKPVQEAARIAGVDVDEAKSRLRQAMEAVLATLSVEDEVQCTGGGPAGI